jgi:hypothetical protein
MADAAYTLFFGAVFVGGASFLHLLTAKEWNRVAAALRGEWFEELTPAPTAGRIAVTERLDPKLEPVAISICRI